MDHGCICQAKTDLQPPSSSRVLQAWCTCQVTCALSALASLRAGLALCAGYTRSHALHLSLRSNFHVVLIWNVGGHFDRPVEKYDGLIWSSNPNEHLGKSSQPHLLSHGIFSFESGFLDFWTIWGVGKTQLCRVLAEEYYVDSKARLLALFSSWFFMGNLLRQDDQTFLNHAAMLVMSNKYTPSTSFMLDFLHFQGIGWLSLLPQIHVLVLEHHPLVGSSPS